jgi:hypothetical protein
LATVRLSPAKILPASHPYDHSKALSAAASGPNFRVINVKFLVLLNENITPQWDVPSTLISLLIFAAEPADFRPF